MNFMKEGGATFGEGKHNDSCYWMKNKNKEEVEQMRRLYVPFLVSILALSIVMPMGVAKAGGLMPDEAIIDMAERAGTTGSGITEMEMYLPKMQETPGATAAFKRRVAKLRETIGR